MNMWDGLFRRRRREEELEEEVQSHLRMAAQDRAEQGETAEQARASAVREFGDVALVKEVTRQMWGWNWLENLVQDVRYGLRQLRRNPGFTAVAVITLAFGIGANTAMFNLVDAMLLRPLPAPNPSQLVELYTINPALSFFPYNLFSYPMLEEIVRSQRVFSEVSGWAAPMLPLEVGGKTFPGGVFSVTGDYFRLLGLRPAVGRLLIPEDDAGTTPNPVVVISYRFWETYYGGNPDVLGKILKVNGNPYTIVGVAPKNFFGLLVGVSVDAWRPLTRTKNRKAEDFYVTARLKECVSIGEARAQLEAMWPSILGATVPEKIGAKERDLFLAQRIRVIPAKTGVLASSLSRFRRPLIVLLCATGIVLLIACLNLASLMLSRAAAREHEMGVRAVLGASRMRLMQQLLTEGTLLAGAGAVLGIPLALWTSRSLANFVWTGVTPLGLDLTVSSHVLEFAAAAAFLTGTLIGIPPAWHATRQGPAGSLQGNPRTLTGRGRRGLEQWLIVTQLALSFLLVVSAGLMTRSLKALLSINPGFRTEGILDLLLQAKPGGHRDFHAASYYRQLMEDLAALPGVRSVSLSQLEPIEPFEWREPVSTNSSDSPTAGPVGAVCEAASPHFFQTLEISLLQGRDFEFSDDAHAPRVAIVSESLARRLFPSGPPLGRLINVGSEPGQQNLRIIGIVSDANLYDVRVQRPPAVYLPLFQRQDPIAPNVEIRASGSSRAIAVSARRYIDALGREYIFRMRTLQEAVSRSLVREQVLAVLADAYGGLAMLLAAIGLYGVLSYSVARRTHEVGIRVALGAKRADVLRMVVAQGFKLTLIGVGIGAIGALGLTRFLASLLYGVRPTDPLTFIAVSLLLTAVALLASYIPARRATKVDPMVALRYE